MIFQDLIHFALHPAAYIRCCIVIQIDRSIETNKMFQEFEVLDFHFGFLFTLKYG